MTNIKPYTLTAEVEGTKIYYQRPDECPLCHNGIPNEPFVLRFVSNRRGWVSLYAITQCPACFEAFLSVYGSQERRGGMKFEYHRDFPRSDFPTKFDSCISSISPDFVEIFHEAEKAEADGLKNICGMGYRKALEFLIRDYVQAKAPDEYNAKKTVHQLIHDCIDSKRIQTAADKCNKLGNDQTHYYTKYSGRDVDDQKKLILAVVYWIQMESVTEEEL